MHTAFNSAVREYLVSIPSASCLLRSSNNTGKLHVSGSVATVKLVLEHGADANAACDAGPPIMWAAGSGKAATVEALIAAGANPNTAGNSNVTALLAASAAGTVHTSCHTTHTHTHIWRNTVHCTALAVAFGRRHS